MQRRIGFDIGDVMAPDLPKRRRYDGTYALVKAFPGCVSAIRVLATVYGPENLFVVSRAFDEMSIRANWDLLVFWDFFRCTLIPLSNVYIYENSVGDPSMKGRLAAEVKLTDFVDDKRTVLDTMPPGVRNLFLVKGPRTKPADWERPPSNPDSQLIVVPADWEVIGPRIRQTPHQ